MRTTDFERQSEEEDVPLMNPASTTRNKSKRRASASAAFISSLTQPYSKTERLLLFVVCFLVVLVFIFGGAYASTSQKDNSLCTTPDCVVTAARIIQNMDVSADPCDDFYQFSCGGWIKRNPIPEDKSLLGTFTVLSEDNQVILKSIFEAPYKPDPSLSPELSDLDKNIFTKSQTLYQTCLNETKVEQDGLTPLINLANRIISQSFPLSGSNSKLDADKLVNAISQISKIGVPVLFNTYVSADNKNPDVNMIQLEQTGISLPSKDYYVDNLDIVAALKSVVQSAFELVGPQLSLAGKRDWAAAAGDVIDIETKIAAIFMTPEQLENPSVQYNPMKISEIYKLTRTINWLDYFDKMFPKSEFPSVISENTVVIVNTVEYFGNFTNVVGEFKPDAVESYILWHVIKSFAPHTTKELRNIKKKLDEKVGSAAAVEPPRWKTCLARMDSIIGDAAGKWFIKEVFSGESKKAAEQTIEMIKSAMIKRVPGIDWIDEPTGKIAVEKIKALIPKIGYPDFVLDPKKMTEKYRELNVVPSEYFSNIQSAFEFEIKSNLKDILQPVDRSRWGMTPATVNAYYNPPLNEIAFPAGILQPPFYSAKQPDYLNFGAIGAVVGHEITHAFDNNGRQFDATGRMIDWWSNKTAKEFEVKQECFVEQYGKYVVEGPDGTKVHVNGKLTLGENLADNGGLSRAYEAWKSELSSSSNQFLPGLDKYTREQLFFVGFGEVWCQAITPAAALRRVRTDPHSPNRLRVHGAVQNSVYFRDAFKCKEGSKMSPTERCQIW